MEDRTVIAVIGVAVAALVAVPVFLFARAPGGPLVTGSGSVVETPAPVPAPAADVVAASPLDRVDAAWTTAASAATGIPERALAAYAAAALDLRDEQPGCGIGWTTLAAIGLAESDHGRHNGSTITLSGVVEPPIIGSIVGDDTDGGAIDGDRTADRAVGPLQFIPDTWARWGADGDGDRVADPHDIDDAALTAARYLCAASGTMTTAAGWDAGIAAYNPDPAYRERVAAAVSEYAAAADALG